MNFFKCLKNLFCKKEPSGIQKVSEPTAAQDKIDLSVVTHVSINTVSKNWDEDAEKDGIDIEISRRDKDDHTVDFKDGSFSGKIYINTEKGKEVYNKAVSVRRRVKIPFEEINAHNGKYGVLFVDVTLPDGRVIKAKEEHVKIKI